MTQLRLQLQGEPGSIAVDTLIAALRSTLRVLREVDRMSRQGGGSAGSWRIEEVWNGSIGVAFASSEEIPAEVPERLVAGLTVLEERAELPPWFSVPAIETVRKMGKILYRPGVLGIALTARTSSGADCEVRLTPDTVGHATEAFDGREEALGSVSGILDVVNLRRGQRAVSLYDADERHGVRCTFQEDLLEPVRRYLGSKVRATGIITRNLAGQVAAVKVEWLERIDEDGIVPSVAELAGIAPWFTGERNAVEHQRWTRGA